MSTCTAPRATDIHTLLLQQNPRQTAGRHAALSLFNTTILARYNPDEYDRVVTHTATGPAPQEFKDAFTATLAALTTLFTPQA